jgi:hypothetical protein
MIRGAKAGAGTTPIVSPPRMYSPSWINRFIDGMDRLPGPAWIAYSLLAATLVAAIFVTKWLDGTYTGKWPDPFHAVLVATWLVGPLGLHYLDRLASQALNVMRPALSIGDEEYASLCYKLTILPALPTALSSLATISFGTPLALTIDEALRRRLGLWTSPVATALEATTVILLLAVGGAFVYHTFRQLTLVSHVYSRLTNVDMFHLRPLHAFSRLTAVTAVMLLAVLWLWNATAPGVLESPLGIANTAFSIIFALVSFLVPLLGIRRVLVARKEEMLHDASERLQAGLRELDRRMDAGRIEGMDQMRHTLEALIIKQKVIESISTWPWSIETPRLVGTAILLPILLFVIQRIIDAFLGL